MGILIFVIILVAIIIFINNTDTKSRIKRIKEMYPEYKYCYWTDGHILIDKEGNIIVIHKTDADNKELHQKYYVKDIISFEIYENHNRIYSKTRTVGGELLFEVPETVFDISTKINDIYNIGLILYADEFTNPLLTVKYIDGVKCKPGDFLYNLIKRNIIELTSLLDYAETGRDKTTKQQI